MNNTREQRILFASPAYYGLRVFIFHVARGTCTEVFVVNARTPEEARGFIDANLGREAQNAVIQVREFDPAREGIHPNAQAIQFRWWTTT